MTAQPNQGFIFAAPHPDPPPALHLVDVAVHTVAVFRAGGGVRERGGARALAVVPPTVPREVCRGPRRGTFRGGAARSKTGFWLMSGHPAVQQARATTLSTPSESGINYPFNAWSWLRLACLAWVWSSSTCDAWWAWSARRARRQKACRCDAARRHAHCLQYLVLARHRHGWTTLFQHLRSLVEW